MRAAVAVWLAGGMEGFDPLAAFGPEVAARYDDEPRGDEEETVDCLARLAGPGPALELAIGTGRVALPLAATGVRVDGIEISEAMVERLRDGQYVDAERVEAGRVTLDVGRYDPVTQILEESHVTYEDGGVRLGPIACRYAGPSEQDLMARMAGLRLVSRYGGWRGEPFTGDSRRHVSVWKPA